MSKSCIFSFLLMIFLLAPFGEAADQSLKPPASTVTLQYFGIHIHRFDGGKGTPWPAVRFGSWRLWDARVAWPHLQPAPDHWDFAILDRYIERAEKDHVEILLPLGLSPSWASSRPSEPSAYRSGNAAPPREMGPWKTYVLTVAKRYKGRVHYYEIWNEPNVPKFFSGTVQQLVELTKEASQAIKSVDPDAKIISPSATDLDGYRYLNDFLNNGGGRWVDIVGYHFYVGANPPERQADLIHQVQRVMADNGISAKPLWNTESGWAHPKPFHSPDLAAAYVARAYILNWAAGVSRFYWYSWDNHDWVSIEMLSKDDKEMTPAGRAYDTIANWLIGAKITSCSSTADGTWTCTLERNGSAQYIYWNTDRTTTVAVPKSWPRIDCEQLLGGNCPVRQAKVEVGQIPILLRQQK